MGHIGGGSCKVWLTSRLGQLKTKLVFSTKGEFGRKERKCDIGPIKSSETPFDFVVCSPSSMETTELWLKLPQPSDAVETSGLSD